MKHNWEYKKLGEVIDFVGGGTPSKSNKSFYEGSIPWASVRDMSKFELDTTEFCITEEAVRNSATNVLPKGTIVISTHVGLGKICTLMQDTAINQDLKGVIFRDSSINKRFFLYWYKSVSDHIISNGKGATVKGVTLDFMKNLRVPIVPKSEQDTIIEELDEINAMIAGRKDQLKELDLLAQSVFHEMFGDPISNPKEFASRKLGISCEVSSAKRVLVEDIVEFGIPFIRGTELVALSKQTAFDPSIFTMFITQEHYDKVKAITGVPSKEDLLIPSINPDGFIWEVNTNSPLYFKDGRVLWVHVNHDVYSTKWLRFALSKVIKGKYSNLSRGAVFTEITLVFLRNLEMVVPPLKMQQLFAEKIEAIEEQKREIEASLRELQTLLDSRMDYWFN